MKVKLEKMKSGIYMWINAHNGKKYIGQADNLERRRLRFINFTTKYAGSLINNVRKHYNSESDWIYKVLEYCSIDKLDEREKYWIQVKGSMKPNGYNLTEGGNTTRGFKFTEESKHKQSLSAIKRLRNKENHPMFGKTGCWSGKKRPNFSGGLNPNSRKIIQYTKDNLLIREYNSMIEAAKITGILQQNISAGCRGKAKSAGGFIWKYK